MFYLYKVENGEYKENISDYNLDILRLDCTEKDLFNFRYNNYKFENMNQALKDNFNKNKDKTLKNIAFISNDFSLSRPSGILSLDFFQNLLSEKRLSIFLVSRYKINEPFNKHKNCFSSSNESKLKEYIKKNNIDILIDMQGHMCNNYNNLMGDRLAPIQLHFLGYPGTIGLSYIDYLIADKTIIPTESAQYYREKIAYLPNCYQVNSESSLVHKKIDLNKTVFNFCNFNTYYKFDKTGLFTWFEILKKVPNSILYLNKGEHTKIISDYANYNNLKDRIVFLDFLPHTQHLKRLSTMDLGLDPYRLNGHTTSSDLISAGVPLITYTGETYHNRVSKSILKSLDLEELVCYSYKDYINLAVKIATNKRYHMYLVNKVKNYREKTLFNSKLYTKNFINLINNIWNHHFKNCLSKKKLMITNFGTHKTNQNYKWNYIPYVKVDSLSDFKDSLIKTIECRGQILRDIADNTSDCFLFTASGLLFKDTSLLKSKLIKTDNYNDGIWYKSVYTNDFIEKIDLQNHNNINKDYDLPEVLIIFKFDSFFKINSKKIIHYFYYQFYSNAKFIIYCKENDFKNIAYYKKFYRKFNIKLFSFTEYNTFIETKNNTYKLFIDKSNFHKIINKLNYIQNALDKKPDNFIIL